MTVLLEEPCKALEQENLCNMSSSSTIPTTSTSSQPQTSTAGGAYPSYTQHPSSYYQQPGSGLGSAVGGTAGGLVGSAITSVMPSAIGEWVVNSLSNASDTLRVYVQQYPPLAGFLFALMALSSIPIGIFLAFAAISSTLTLGTALAGFALVEGVLIFVSGSVLFATLGGIGLFTTMVFSWIGLLWYGSKGAYMLVQKVAPNLAPSLSQSHPAQAASNLMSSVQQGIGMSSSQNR